MAESNPEPTLIRRYPNRRFYDTSRSGHITLEEIRDIVSEGQDIKVEDSKSGEDITTKVLTQIILEFDAPKLDVFPKEMLYELIRFNDRMVGEFFDNYFKKAFSSFMESQKQFESLFRQTQLLNPFFSPFSGNGEDRKAPEPQANDREAEALKQELNDLRRELADVRQQLKPKPARKRATKT